MAVAAGKAAAGSAKKADRKPKVAARKRPAMGLGPGAVGSLAQQVGMQGAAATAVAGSLAQQAGMRAEAATDRVAGDVPQVSVISAGPVEWQSVTSNRVTIPADNVARLLEQISTAVDTLRGLPTPAGDNHAPARAEATDNFEVFIRLGTATVRVVNEQAQSERPGPVVVTQNAHAMEAVALGATGFLTKLSDGIVKGAGIAIGTAGVSHYHIADRLLNELDHLIGALLQELPNLIDGLHQWAALIVS